MKYSVVNPNNNKNGTESSQPQARNTQVISQEPQWSLNEVQLPDHLISIVECMIAFFFNREKLLNEWKFKRFLKVGGGLVGNCFGPSGTGKSIFADALAKALSLNIIKVNWGDLQSELLGGTSKNLTYIFRRAKETNSLLLFDEADALLSKRIGNVSQAADHGINSAKTTLLTLLDQHDGVVIFTTNIFSNYDTAFLRRILFHLEFSSPNFEMRKRIWTFHLSEVIPKSISYEDLATMSEGLCGGDIRNISIQLGLKLLIGQSEVISESLVQEEIDRHKAVKEQHKKANFLQSENFTSLKKMEEQEHGN